MSEPLTSIVLLIGKYVLEKLLSFGLERLSQTMISSEFPLTLEIQDSEIITKIGEILPNILDHIDNNSIDAEVITRLSAIQYNQEEKTQIIQQVLSITKSLISRLYPDSEISNGIILSLPQPEEGQSLDENFLKEWLNKSFFKQIDKILEIPSEEIPVLPQPEPSTTNNQQQSINNNPNTSNTGLAQNEENSTPPKPQAQENNIIMLEKLDKYKKYGESVLQKIKSLEQNQSSEILENRQLQDCLKNVKNAANDTVKLASSPVKIAVMGEFSSGKTLLIGNLIGYADALPISEIPTTGNVTAINLFPQEDLKTTEFDNFIVEYLSHPEVKQCLEFMLEEAKKRVQTLDLTALSEVNSETLDQDILNRWENWCEQTWNKTQNLELRYLLRELIMFIRAYSAFGTDLCGESLKINHTNAREGLKLTSISPVNQELKFEDIPLNSKTNVDKKRPSPELLQKSFSLIRRVNINVKISKQIWNLGTTKDTAKFILLDFPGLGAADSGVRDTFVSLRELEEVQTILIILNGRTPGSDRVNRIFNMIQQKRPKPTLKDFILVGVGRFNQLPIEQEQKLDQMIKSTANNSLTETIVFQEFSELKTIIDQASALTSQKNRIILLDQLIGLAELAKLFNNINVGSPEFLAKLADPNDISLQQSKRMGEKWKNLSDGLLATDPHSSLGKQLSWFAQEGGMGKLRELILNHVAAHSLNQLHEDTRRDANKLGQQQDHLKQVLSELGISSEESQKLSELRKHLETMTKTYKYRKKLRKEPLKDRRGIAITDVIKEEVSYQIFAWREWYSLFNKSQDGIIILPPIGQGDHNRRRLFIPTKSDDFYEIFDKTINTLQEFTRQCIKDGIINLLQQLSNELEREMQYLKDNLNDTMEEDIKNQLGEEQAYIFYSFYKNYDPNNWKKDIIDTAFEADTPIDTKVVFPLACKNEKHENGQFLDWASEYKEINIQTQNQILLVQRLRDEITASISLHLIEYVGQINKKVEEKIMYELGELIFDLDALQNEEPLLRCIAGEKQKNQELDSVSPILSQIASIPHPDISN